MSDETSKTAEVRQALTGHEVNESYFQLVWRRFRRSTVSIVGAFLVMMLVMLAIFADFFSPTSLYEIDLKDSSFRRSSCILSITTATSTWFRLSTIWFTP